MKKKKNLNKKKVHNERKPVVAETFIRTLKNKIYKYVSY